MKSADSVNWAVLLDSNKQNQRKVRKWATEKSTTRELSDSFKGTDQGSEFRRLVRTNGTTYGRRLARKALKYRGVV